MKNCLVSIIVPIYNAEKYLKKCLDSVINQTYRNIDIILIDDGSLDNSLEIAKEYARKDLRVRVFSQTNMGLIATRKRGVDLAKGELIGFVDSDDWIEQNMYEKLVFCMIHSKCDLVSSGIFHDYENENKECEEILDIYQEGLYTNLHEEIFPSMLYDSSNGMGLKCTLVNKLYRKQILSEIYQNIDTRVFYGEDALAVYQYCLKCKSIYILRKSFYHYFIRNNSMCRTANEKLSENTYYLYEGLKKDFLKYRKPHILMSQLKKYILRLEMHTLNVLYGIDVTMTEKWDFSRFDKIIGKQIILYGAGECGKAFYRNLVQIGYENTVVQWVDKKVCGLIDTGLPEIKPINQIQTMNYDYILIAIQNEIVAKQAMEELINNYSIASNKIIY